MRVFGFTTLAALLGAFDHGFQWHENIANGIVQFTFLFLGLVIAYFVQATIHERWGPTVSEKTHKWALVGAMAFYIIMVFLKGAFLIFLGYEGLGIIFALLIFNNLYFTSYRRDHGLILLGIIVSIVSALVQGTKSGSFTIGLPFDHNSAFHLLQIISGALIFLGVKEGLQLDNHSNPTTAVNLANSPAEELIDIENKPVLNGHSVKSKSLARFEIFNDLTKEQVKRIKKLSLKEKYSPNSVIIEDGTKAKCFYLITEGDVSIRKGGIELATKGADTHIGIMPLVDGSTRSANVVAKEPTTVLRIPYKKIKSKENQDIFAQIINNQLIAQQDKLRRMNDVTIVEVKQKLQEAELREESSGFFISLVFGLVMYQFILGCFLQWSDIKHSTSIMEIFTPLFTVVVGIMSLAYAIRSMYPLSDFGLHLNNWKADIIEALKWTTIFLIAIVAAKGLLSFIPGNFFYNKPILEPIAIDKYGSAQLTIVVFVLYVFLVPVQELVARAVIQSSLMRVFSGKWMILKAILLSNLMFSAFHLYLDMQFAVLTFIPGIFWGYLFAKQRGLLGVSISHIIIGCFALIYLNFH